MLTSVIEENKLLKKKLKYNTDILQSGYFERDEPKDRDDVDLFFKSSFGPKDQEENNKEFSIDIFSSEFN